MPCPRSRTGRAEHCSVLRTVPLGEVCRTLTPARMNYLRGGRQAPARFSFVPRDSAPSRGRHGCSPGLAGLRQLPRHSRGVRGRHLQPVLGNTVSPNPLSLWGSGAHLPWASSAGTRAAREGLCKSPQKS